MPRKLTPAELSSVFQDKAERVSAESVAAVIEAIVEGDFKIVESSQPHGNEMLGQWITVQAENEKKAKYRLYFPWNEDKKTITNCFGFLSPSGKQYNVDTDGGVVSMHVELPVFQQFNQMVIDARAKEKEERKVGIMPCWVVVMDADTDHWNRLGIMYDEGTGKRGLNFPLGVAGLHYEESAAQLEMAKYLEYRADVRAKGESLPPRVGQGSPKTNQKEDEEANDKLMEKTSVLTQKWEGSPEGKKFKFKMKK